MKKCTITLLLIAVMFALLPIVGFASSDAGGRLIIYTSIPTPQLNMMIDMFNSQYPGIVVDVHTSKSSNLLSHIKNESASPQGDILLGEDLASFQSLKEYMSPYISANNASIYSQYLVDPSICTPIQLHVSAMIINPASINNLGAEVDSWASLTDEKLSGHALYTDPSTYSSDQQQIDFIQALATSMNITSPSSPSFVLNAVDAGQFAVGIINEERAIERKVLNNKLDIVYAQDAAAISASYAGLLSGAKNEENAKLFIDFITSKNYQQAAASFLYMRSVRNDVSFDFEGIAATEHLFQIYNKAQTQNEAEARPH